MTWTSENTRAQEVKPRIRGKERFERTYAQQIQRNRLLTRTMFKENIEDKRRVVPYEIALQGARPPTNKFDQAGKLFCVSASACKIPLIPFVERNLGRK
ncbi:hypothetical protein ABKN59_003230 [Abortiporus biennis]